MNTTKSNPVGTSINKKFTAFFLIESNKKTQKKKVGRNEKCPCGSEKKFKHCCGNI